MGHHVVTTSRGGPPNSDIKLDLNQVEVDDLQHLTAGVDRVVVTVPPTPLGDTIGDAYQRLADGARSVPHLVHTSSTGVYAKTTSHPTVTEASGPFASTPRAGRLLTAERAVLNHPHATVFRLAGLIGPDRHPIERMAGQPRPGGGAPVNLIHRDDVTAAITLTLTQGGPPGTFNLAADEHPTREAYYTHEAAQRSVEAPRFDGTPDLGAVVTSDAFKRATGWTPKHPLSTP